jgi:hypothetical protein
MRKSELRANLWRHRTGTEQFMFVKPWGGAYIISVISCGKSISRQLLMESGEAQNMLSMRYKGFYSIEPITKSNVERALITAHGTSRNIQEK